MRNQVLCAIAAMATLFFANGCKKEVADSPSLSLAATEYTVSADGGSVSVPFELKNATDASALAVEPAADYDWVAVSVGESSIDLSVAMNETAAPRTAEFTVSYPGALADASFTLTQEAGEPAPTYDYEWNMVAFSSAWYGDQYGMDGEHNYYTTVGDKDYDADGNFQDGGTYYIFDLYAPAPADESVPTIPEGTYTLGEPSATAEWTFSPDFSGAVRYEGDSEWSAEFASGTVTVSYEGTVITLEASLTDLEGKTHHFVYTGDGECLNLAPVDPGFGEDVSFDPTSAGAYYSADDGVSMEVIFQFTDMPTGDDGYLVPPGTLLNVDVMMPYDENGKIAAGTYSASFEGTSMTFYPGEDFFGLMYMGTYAQKGDADGSVYVSLVEDGTFTVSESGGVYTIDCDFMCADGYKLTCSWTGELEVSGMPGPISTLTGDYTVDLEGAVAEGNYWGDYYGTGGSNWDFQILPGTGSDGFMADIVSETVDFSDGIPTGTYKAAASGYPAPGEYLPGYESGSSLGGTMYLGGFDEMGYVSEYAPAMSGDLNITNNGDGTYNISFEFTDDLGYKVDGEWSGTISLTNQASESYSLSSVSASSRHSKSMMDANISRGAQTPEQKAELLKKNGFKTEFSVTPKSRTSSFRALRK